MGRDSLLLKLVAGNVVTVYCSTAGGLTQLLRRCWGLEVLKPGHHVLFSEYQQWTLLSLCISFASTPASWSTPANQSTSMYLPVFTSLLSLNIQREMSLSALLANMKSRVLEMRTGCSSSRGVGGGGRHFCDKRAFLPGGKVAPLWGRPYPSEFMSGT